MSASLFHKLITAPDAKCYFLERLARKATAKGLYSTCFYSKAPNGIRCSTIKKGGLT